MLAIPSVVRLAVVAVAAALIGCAAPPVEEAEGSTTALETAPRTANTELDEHYSDPAEWQLIADKSLARIGPKAFPCATYASFAIETFAHVKFPEDGLLSNVSHHFDTKVTVPMFPADPQNGVVRHMAVGPEGEFSPRSNTTGLAGFLINEKSWKAIWSPDDLRPGDVVFGMPADDARHPAHAYVFHEWVEQKGGWGFVIDNEGDGHCDPSDAASFVAYCDADGSGTALCCKGPGQHMYKRSIKDSITEPNDPSETDEGMWFALRSPT